MFTRGTYLMVTKSTFEDENGRIGQSGPRWHFITNSPASATERSWHSLVELLTWNADPDKRTTYWDPSAKRFIIGDASAELRDYATRQFQHFIKHGKPEDASWPETNLVSEENGD